MVSSASCRGNCSNSSPKPSSRALNIDRTKDYSLPLQVETSVEYDLPSHIYPPKGSEPILMIHPAYLTPVRARKVPVTSHSPVLSSSSGAKPLSTLQIHGNPTQPPQTRSVSKASQSKSWCSCGNPNCNSSSASRASSVRNSNPQSSVLSNRQVTQIPENVLYSAVKSNMQSTDVKNQQKQLQHKVQIHKHIQQVQQQKQLQQQHLQQVQLQQQLQERAKLQAQQLQHLQSQQQQQQQKSQQTTNSLSRQQSTSDHLISISWGVGGRCHGPCCQPRVGALAPSQAEFLAPGLPPSLLTRTPNRGQAGGSPKLRARTRRGLSVASTVNLPEYFGSARSSRTCSVGGLIAGSSHAHSRTRSSSMLAATPAPITAHQVASALDVVRAHVLTPRSLFASSQHQKQLQTNIGNTSSLLSTVGQSRDSGCSLSAEMTTTGNNFSSSDNTGGKNVEWSWSVVDSGFCTPVDTNEDQVMEAFDSNTIAIGSYTPLNAMSASHSVSQENATINSTSSSNNNSTPSNLHWTRDFSTPLSSSTSLSSLHTSFLPSSNPHYIPQPIWNLAY